MKEAGAGLLARQEYRSHLHGLCAKSQGGDYAARICDATGGNHWHVDHVGNLRDERKSACKRILRGAEERTAVASGFESGSNDGVDARVVQCCGFIWGGCTADGDDAFRAALIQDFSRWNSYDETEDRHFCIQQRAGLILKSQWRIWLVLWP